MPEPAHRYEFGAFTLNPAERRLAKHGEPLVVGPRAFDLLVALVERAGRLVTKEELMERVWPKLVVEENNLQVQVSALRKLLGSQAIATVPGRGYRLTVEVKGNEVPAAAVRDGSPSIAVLPFVNISGDAANEYFADGIAEELLNVLSKIRGLRVASRTSAFSFKGGNVDIPTVARKLNVGAILEGSVRKFGNRVRITAQLVDVASDSHLWSETYDRELADIFAVQDDIAQSVVKELRAALLNEPRDRATDAAVDAEVDAARRGHTTNAGAYALYLKARSMVARRTQASVMTGIEHLRKAVGIDPQFARAWAALAQALTVAAGSGGWLPFDEGYARARKAAQQALALEPELAEAHVALSIVLVGNDWDWPGAQLAMRRALALAPGNAEVVLAAGWTSAVLGPLSESIALCHRAIALDPLNPHAHRYLSIFCMWADLLDDAEAAARATADLSPHGGMTHAAVGDVYLLQARYDEALAEYEKESHDGFRLLGLAAAYHALARDAEAAAALEELAELPMHGYLNAQAHAYCGRIDAAFEWLERAHAQRNAGLCQMKFQPRLRNLHGDPRWRAFLRRMLLAD